MGRVFQSYYTKPGVFELDASGAPVADAKAKPKLKRFYSELWTIEYTDALGHTIRKAGGTKAKQAEAALRKAEERVYNEKHSLPTINVAELSCYDLLRKWLESLKGHTGDAYRRDVETYCKRVIDGCRAGTIAQLRPDAVEAFLNRLADEEDLAPRTVNAYLEALKSCLQWAVKSRFLPYSPLDCVQKRNEHERRRLRRALSDAELSRMLAAALDGPRRRALNLYQNRPRKDGTFKPVEIPLQRQAELAEQGRRNALIYRLLVQTGLRVNEARLLAWNDISLEAATLTTRPEWVGNKNGKRETLPLAADLVEALKVWRERHPAEEHEPVIKLPQALLKRFNDDLVAAGLAKRIYRDRVGKVLPVDADGRPLQKPHPVELDKRDASGRTLDLHALRHTHGTRLVASGADIKTVQALMRHSTPAMTLGIYVHADKGRMADAVGNLPELHAAAAKEPELAVLAKTGTDDKDEPPPPSNRQGSKRVSRKTSGNKRLAMVGAQVWDQEVAGSNPVAPIFTSRIAVDRYKNGASHARARPHDSLANPWRRRTGI
ncbi:MAG TPA: site-specific integrase [Planctomycetota bacterium]